MDIRLTVPDVQVVANEIAQENVILKAAQRNLIRRITELEMELATLKKEENDVPEARPEERPASQDAHEATEGNAANADAPKADAAKKR